MADNNTTQDRVALRVWHDNAGYLIHGGFSVTEPQGLVRLIETMAVLRPLLVAQERRRAAEITNAE